VRESRNFIQCCEIQLSDDLSCFGEKILGEVFPMRLRLLISARLS